MHWGPKGDATSVCRPQLSLPDEARHRGHTCGSVRHVYLCAPYGVRSRGGLLFVRACVERREFPKVSAAARLGLSRVLDA